MTEAEEPLLGNDSLNESGGLSTSLLSADKFSDVSMIGIGSLAMKYAKFIDRFKLWVLLFWLLLLAPSAYFGPLFLSATSNDFAGPPGTQAYNATQALERDFQLSHYSALILFVHSKHGNSSIIGPDLCKYTFALQDRLNQYPGAPCDDKSRKLPCISSFEGYYTLKDRGLPAAQLAPLLKANDSATVIEVNANIIFGSNNAVEFAKYVKSESTHLLNTINATWSNAKVPDSCGKASGNVDLHNVQVDVTGVAAFIPAVEKSIEHDFALCDGIALPLAVIVLGLILRSARLLLLPFLCIATAALVSLSIMYFVAQTMAVLSVTPSLMMSILVAMTIDYSLFLLSRAREELLVGRSTERAVVAMLSSAGHTILVSGITLAGCFTGLTLLPMPMAQTLGIGCSLTILITLAVELTVVPSILLLFPHWTRKAVLPFQFFCLSITWGAVDEEVFRSGGGGESGKQNLLTSDAFQQLVKEQQQKTMAQLDNDIGAEELNSCRGGSSSSLSSKDANDALSCAIIEGNLLRRSLWYKLGRWTQRWPIAILLIIVSVAVTLPADFNAVGFKTTAGLEDELPRNDEATNAFLDMASLFGPSVSYSMRMIVERVDGGSVMTPETMAHITDVIDLMSSELPATGPANFTGMMWIDGQNQTDMLFKIAGCCDKKMEPSARQQRRLAEPLFSSVHASSLIHQVSSSPLDSKRAAVDDANSFECILIDKFCPQYDYFKSQFLSGNENATSITVLPGLNPMGVEGQDWYNAVLSLVTGNDTLRAQTGLNIYLYGVPPGTWASISVMSDRFPMMISVTAGIVLLFTAISFRSIIVALRSIASIALTQFFCYGTAVLIYEHGMLNWLGIPGLSENGGLNWGPPILCFSIVTGLCLDYDFFLLVRIREYRLLGHSNSEAVARAMARTGSVITSAGVIMAVAFAGLLFSQIPTINQISSFLVLAALFDTFVVRSLFVPSLMGLIGDLNWWPTRPPPLSLPPAHKCVLEMTSIEPLN